MQKAAFVMIFPTIATALSVLCQCMLYVVADESYCE